jgi:hypothetical protein
MQYIITVKSSEIAIIKSTVVNCKILVRGSPLAAVCPTCGVISNLFPDFENSEGTFVAQKMGHCGHDAEGYFEIKERL